VHVANKPVSNNGENEMASWQRNGVKIMKMAIMASMACNNVSIMAYQS
jgi:hypothetical protein